MNRKHIGDGPIERVYLKQMHALAEVIDEALNDGKKGKDRENGFVLLVFPFEGREGRANYISSAKRSDVLALLKEQVARFEGQPEMKGSA